ncbi:hypothetical protein CEXT_798741 [Caerostris extrusa]|uniref:Uncharacterized protein n=1 Tax=Caerostris extrusa TaxID=172846 RepID=A0AAV4MBF5_CAEEX|nr:hypothetical protein CEXT_798741 [Caerostris extrusa]
MQYFLTNNELQARQLYSDTKFGAVLSKEYGFGEEEAITEALSEWEIESCRFPEHAGLKCLDSFGQRESG